MTRINKYLNFFILAFGVLLLVSCVHDDEYNTPADTENYQCKDLSQDTSLQVISLKDAKALFKGSEAYTFLSDSNLYLEGYVSSSDETGNLYKTLYIQDAPVNPTEGFTISMDLVSSYLKFPQGSKIYVKLAGLSIGEYGGMPQLGKKIGDETSASRVSRIPEQSIPHHIFKSCNEREIIVPKEMTLAEMKRENDRYLGVLIKVKDAEFHNSVLCKQFAPNGQTVSMAIEDPTWTITDPKKANRVVRNSGYATFAPKTLPSGKGDLVGILSKFTSTYQIYVLRESDLDMNSFPRKDGIISAPCQADQSGQARNIAQVKQMFANGNLSQIAENIHVTARVIANDETGNLYKYFYIEDETGGIRINVNATELYQDRRFQVGRALTINLKGLYIAKVNDEFQIGGLYNGRLGQIETSEIYKHFFLTNLPVVNIKPTERTITQLSPDDVGRWIKIKDLQFIDADLGKPYADGTNTTNRTLTDCQGNEIILRTSGKANFGNRNTPLLANVVQVDSGKGDVYAVLSIYRGKYQLWITKLRDIDLDAPRCDGSLPNFSTETLFKDEFSNLNRWEVVNVSGAEKWSIANFGNPKPSAVMNGNRKTNEDWMVTKEEITIPTDYKEVYVEFETDGRYQGATLELLVTENYSNVTDTRWEKLNIKLDTDLQTFGGWTNSGKVDLKSYMGKKVKLAFKYVSSSGASTTWEVDNFVVKGVK